MSCYAILCYLFGFKDSRKSLLLFIIFLNVTVWPFLNILLFDIYLIHTFWLI